MPTESRALGLPRRGNCVKVSVARRTVDESTMRDGKSNRMYVRRPGKPPTEMVFDGGITVFAVIT